MKALISHFQRRLVIEDPSIIPSIDGLNDRKPVIWNGQGFDKSCLLDRPFANDAICGDVLPDDLNTLSPSGDESIAGNGDGSDYPDGQDDGPLGTTITYQAGTPSPTCTTNCGTLCTGYYCTPNHTENPSDFTDPINLSHLPTDLPTLTSPTSTTASCVASGAVTTCAAGPGGQSACVTTATCTSYSSPTSAAPTTTAPAPSPTPENAFVLIALEELLITSQLGGDWYRSWNVFSAPLAGAIDTCGDENIFVKTTTSATGNSPQPWPSANVGSLYCPGIYLYVPRDRGLPWASSVR